MEEVEREALDRLRPLFQGFPGLLEAVDAVLQGAMGQAYADDAERPSVGVLRLDFHLIAGDAAAPAAEEVIRGISGRASIVVSDSAWEALVRRICGDKALTRTRVAFRPGVWQPESLRRFTVELPDGFALRRVTEENVEQFAALEHSLVQNYLSLERFVDAGVGFGVEHNGRFVTGCASFALSSRRLEFEIQTHTDFRRRGLAAAAGAAMIEYCLEKDLEPCWDAHNEMSRDLALKLGFRDPAPYNSFGPY